MKHLEPARELLFLAIGVWIGLAVIKAVLDLIASKAPTSTAANAAVHIFDYPFK